MSGLRFQTIDIKQHFDSCIALRLVSYVASFGTEEGFEKNYNVEDYRERLQTKISDFPEGCVHLWKSDRIIGQIEMKRLLNPDVAYVNLFVLFPEFQSKGYGAELMAFSEKTAREAGLSEMQLSVHKSNLKAMKFYEKYGWDILREREDKPYAWRMSKVLSG